MELTFASSSSYIASESPLDSQKKVQPWSQSHCDASLDSASKIDTRNQREEARTNKVQRFMDHHEFRAYIGRGKSSEATSTKPQLDGLETYSNSFQRLREVCHNGPVPIMLQKDKGKGYTEYIPADLAILTPVTTAASDRNPPWKAKYQQVPTIHKLVSAILYGEVTSNEAGPQYVQVPFTRLLPRSLPKQVSEKISLEMIFPDPLKKWKRCKITVSFQVMEVTSERCRGLEHVAIDVETIDTDKDKSEHVAARWNVVRENLPTIRKKVTPESKRMPLGRSLRAGGNKREAVGREERGGLKKRMRRDFNNLWIVSRTNFFLVGSGR